MSSMKFLSSIVTVITVLSVNCGNLPHGYEVIDSTDGVVIGVYSEDQAKLMNEVYVDRAAEDQILIFPDGDEQLNEEENGSNAGELESSPNIMAPNPSTPCAKNGGACMSKKNKKKCQGTLFINKEYKCRWKNVCCMPGAVELLLQSIKDDIKSIKKNQNDLGCVFGDTAYPDGGFIENTCMILQCLNGNWSFIDYDFNPKCGNCKVDGEPSITTYELHTINNRTIASYSEFVFLNYFTEFVLTQPGLNKDRYLADFGVYAKFNKCEEVIWGNYSCVTGITYFEPGIYITLEDTTHVYDLDFLDIEPDSMKAIKVYLNGREITIGESVSSFFGTYGTVLVFKSIQVDSLPGNDPLNCINIVGSKGLSVNFCQNKWTFDSIWVWAMPYLKAEQTTNQTSGQLYGLCDQYTISGEELDYYTMQTGVDTTDSTAFADTWEMNLEW